MNPTPSRLADLVGMKLGSVTFGVDGWRLELDGYAFTIWSRIEIAGPDAVVRDGDDAFRDRLCERIGQTLRAIEWNAEGVTLSFADDITLFLSTRPQDYRGPEAVMLTSARWPGPIVV